MSEQLAPSAGRAPLPLDQALARMHLDGPQASLASVLNGVTTHRAVLQDFRTLDACLEAELSNVHWQTAGVSLFAENDVPYAINNTSQLSDRASEVLFRNCQEFEPAGRIHLLELGAGTGLFARYLLDAFRQRCEQAGRDYYQRLSFHVTDGSSTTVQQWQERAVFAEHAEHVVLAVCDALQPDSCTPPGAASRPLPAPRAVFCNYILDSLAYTVVRRGPGGPEELQVRTRITEDEARLQRYTRLKADALRELARSPDAAQRARLAPLVPCFEYETSFRPVERALHGLDAALTIGAGQDRVLLNQGALLALDRLVARLEDHGFVMVNDYGPVEADQFAVQAVPQRFGRTIALGLNFPLLQHHLAAGGCQVARPEDDDRRSIHTRLVSRNRLPRTVEAFNTQFGPGEAEFEQLTEAARRHLEAGRQDEAMDCYKRAMARHPRDWRLLGEVAEFLIRSLGNFDAGLATARAAVAINPWYSAWLWNVVGDALYATNAFEEAHEAYLQGQRIDPRDVRTHLNLAYTFAGFGEHRAALDALACGLAHDTTGLFRERLLQKQQEVLLLIGARAESESDWLNRRAARLRS